MNPLKRFGLFWYDFLVGDDWRVLIGAAIALGLTYALAHNGIAAWWVLPLLILGLLAASVSRVTRSPRGSDG